MRKHLVTGIDIGSSLIRVVVVAHSNTGAPQIVATASRESRGLRHGYIVNFDEAIAAIRATVKEAERKAEASISRAFLAVGGISLSAVTNEASIAISKADGEVTELDLERVLALSESNLRHNPNNRIIHTIPLLYKVDGKKVLGKPKGMKGSILEIKTLFVTALDQHLETLVRAVEAAGVQVEDVAAAPIAASLVTLTKHQRTVGCILANIGAETVSIAVFEENLPISLQVFPFGSSDITNDIALGLKLPLEDAEEMKVHRERTLSSRKKLDEIIMARLSDIFELIEAHLKKVGRNGLLPAGIILTGGGAGIEMVEQLAKNSLRIPAKTGSVVHPKASGEETDKKAATIKDASWAVAYGLCILGLTTEADDAMHVRLIQQTKSNFIGWIKQFLP
ncbi:MAG: cell division protein FtsA [Parcubacteria group bacterium RIFOXYD2_FULL_52_8]|nr:MAG: cell division protein FtsA [Parcubacteria group bacterium RIFOXYD2_FULL_52_8]